MSHSSRLLPTGRSHEIGANPVVEDEALARMSNGTG